MINCVWSASGEIPAQRSVLALYCSRPAFAQVPIYHNYYGLIDSTSSCNPMARCQKTHRVKCLRAGALHDLVTWESIMATYALRPPRPGRRQHTPDQEDAMKSHKEPRVRPGSIVLGRCPTPIRLELKINDSTK